MSSAFPPPTAATGLSALAIISSRFVRLGPEFSSVMLTRFVINHHCIISSSVILSSTLCIATAPAKASCRITKVNGHWEMKRGKLGH